MALKLLGSLESSGGNVGIGTAAPDSKLHIEGSTNGTGSGADAILHVKQNGGWNANQPWALYVEGYSYLNGFRINAADGIRALHKVASGGQLGFSVTDTAPITFTQSNSTERMRVHTNGYVGIGTASPSTKLHVKEGSANIFIGADDTYGANYSAIGFGGLTNGFNRIFAGFDGSAVYDDMYYAAGTGRGHQFRTNGSGGTKVIITSAGNVGIGTTSPGSKLHVNGDVIRVVNSTWSGIESHNTNGSWESFIGTESGGGGNRYNSASSQHTFYNNSNAVARINSSGNLGIGTTNPTAPLHVIGTVRMGNTSDGLTFTSGSGIGNIIGVDTGFASYNAVAIKASANTGIYLDTADKVGIGTTGPIAKLDVQSTGLAANPTIQIVNTSSGTFNHSINAFAPNLTTGENNIFIIGRAASTKNSGYIGYKYSAAGSNLNVLTFGHWASDNLMNLTGDGKLGIGTTSPNAKLEVTGETHIGSVSDGPFTALRLMNQKTYGSGTGTNEKVRFAMGIAESGIAYSGREGFVIDVGIGDESDSSNAVINFQARDGGVIGTYQTVNGHDKSVEFTGAVTTGGKLYIGATSATTTATTALLLGAAGEVKKRALGSNAFNSTTIPTGTASSKAVTDFIQDFGTSTTSNINTIGNASGKYRWNNTTTGRPASSQENEYGTLLNLHYSGNLTTQIAHDIDQANLWIRSLDTESDTGTAWKQIADTAYVSAAVAGIVDSAPAALDTLNELAAALGNDDSFSTTMSTALGNRLRIDVNNQSLSSTELANARTNLGLGTAATAASTAFVAVGGDTMTGDLTVEGSLTVGKDNTTPQVKLIYDDHANGDGWDTLIEVGRLEDRVRAGNNFPTYLDIDGFGISFQALSDGVVYGMEEYAAGHHRPVIAWGDDTSDSPMQFRFSNTSIFTVGHQGNITASGTLSASGYNDSNWNTAYTYSQVGHLPLAGGTVTGDVVIAQSNTSNHWALKISTNGSNNSGFWTTNEDVRLLLRDNSGNIRVDLYPDSTSRFYDSVQFDSTITHNGVDLTSGTSVDQITEFPMTFQLEGNTWTDTGIDGTDLSTGTYTMQVYVSDFSVGGQHYYEYYSATISWYSGSTNSTVVDEIPVHRAGHAPNAGDLQFRTQRASGTDSHDLMLQVKTNSAYTGELDNSSGGKIMRFKFRRLM